MKRERLPDRRFAETCELVCEGLRYTVTVGRFDDDRIAEVFLLLISQLFRLLLLEFFCDSFHDAV
jgi:hypothetical protein